MAMDKEQCCENPALVMECALDMGETMLRCGAEILRVEDTVTRICTAYGGGIVDVFTILSLIILSWKTDDGRNYTLTRRINPYPTDLKKLEELNALSRYICEKKPSCAEIERHIRTIMAPEKRRIYKSKLSGYVLLASAFAIFFRRQFAGWSCRRNRVGADVPVELLFLIPWQKQGCIQPGAVCCVWGTLHFGSICRNRAERRQGDDWEHHAARSGD